MKKIPWKMIVDILMLALLLLQMAYVLTGQRLHEWTGTIMAVLIIFHNILNRKWYKALGKGSYRPRRIMGTILNFLSLALILALFVSGVAMSRYVYDFLPIHGGRALARKVHIVCAYWGFFLMSAHFGMHWEGIWGKMKKACPVWVAVGKQKLLLSVISTVVSVYGLWAVYRHEILGFLFMKNEFAIFDPNQSIFLFLLDYAAILILVVNLVRRREHV